MPIYINMNNYKNIACTYVVNVNIELNSYEENLNFILEFIKKVFLLLLFKSISGTLIDEHIVLILALCAQHSTLSFFFMKQYFFLIPTLKFWKNEKKNNNKKQKTLGDIIIYTSAPKIMIICYTVLEIYHVKDCHFSFWAIFCPDIPLTAQKIKTKKTKKTKKIKNDHHFCTKNHDHDVIVIFQFKLFLPFYLP